MGESGFLILLVVVILGFGMFFMGGNNYIVNRVYTVDTKDLANMNVNKQNYQSVISKLNDVATHSYLDNNPKSLNDLTTFKQTLALLEKAKQFTTDSPSLYSSMGVVQNQIASFIDLQTPNDPEIIKNLENSVTNLKQALKLKPKDNFNLLVLADSLIQLSQKYSNQPESAISYANEANNNLGLIDNQTLQVNLKILYANEAVNLANIKSVLNQANANDLYQTAITTYLSLLTKNPNDITINTNLASCYMNQANQYLQKNDTTDAIIYINQAVNIEQKIVMLNPKDFESLNNYARDLTILAQVNQQIGNKLEAVKSYTLALDINNRMLTLKPNDNQLLSNISILNQQINQLK